jgi:hypothetical protein
VLRRTSAELEEPIRLRPDLRASAPIIRSQSPEETEASATVRQPATSPSGSAGVALGEPVPYNPLRP